MPTLFVKFMTVGKKRTGTLDFQKKTFSSKKSQVVNQGHCGVSLIARHPKEEVLLGNCVVLRVLYYRVIFVFYC